MYYAKKLFRKKNKVELAVNKKLGEKMMVRSSSGPLARHWLGTPSQGAGETAGTFQTRPARKKTLVRERHMNNYSATPDEKNQSKSPRVAWQFLSLLKFARFSVSSH
jgi:hypothetical protein